MANKSKPKGTATKRDPKKWAAAKSRAKAKMGGKWSARAAQLAVKYYKDAGGKYKGKKPTAKNNKLKKWTKQDWQWSGDRKKKSSVNDSLIDALIDFSKEAEKKGKGVYLPAKSIDALKSTKKGRNKLRAASRKKTEATRKGEQHASHGLHKGKKRSKLGEEKLKVLAKLQEYLSNKGVKTASENKALEDVKKKLRVAILSGSTGDDPEELSRSRAIAEAYRDYLTSHGAEVDWMDMRNMDDMPDTYDWDTDWYSDYKKRLTDADAMVLSTPIFNYGPSGKVLQFLHRTLDKENQQFKPYSLLSGAGSPRSALALGGLANQLDTEIKGIGIGGGVQVAGDEFNVETGEMDPGIVSRVNENAAKLLQVAGALRDKTSNYMKAYEIGVKLAMAEFDDYNNTQDPDGYDAEELKADVEDPKDFRSTRYREAQTPATNNYADPKAKSNFASEPPEVTPDQTFGTNYPKRDRMRGKYNG